MTVVLLDPGHGGSDPGATFRSYEEEDFTLTIALIARDHLLENFQVDVVMTRTNDRTVSLEERTSLANRLNVDFFCSIHVNSGGGTGFESYIYNRGASNKTIQYRSIIHNHIMSVIGPKYNVQDRGKKSANFFVLRETKMPAVLLETLFIDNPNDIKLLTSSAFISDFAASVAEGIGKALNLKRKTSTTKKPSTKPSAPASNNTLYKVIAGSFKERKNAEQRVKELKGKNVDSFISPANVNGTSFYRVQAGAFQHLENAKEQLAKLVQLGYKDAFILTPEEQRANPPRQNQLASLLSTSEPQASATEDISILGEPLLSGTLLDQFVKNTNPDAPQLGDLYIQLSKLYGIRGDIAYAQAIHETNYFRFTGVVDRSQNNFAGIGATGPNVRGASFSTPREGVLAHLQHLFAYATTKPLPSDEPLVDPRFHYVKRGSATTWKELNGKWAVPGDRYGEMILSIYRSNLQFAVQQLSSMISELNKHV